MFKRLAQYFTLFIIVGLAIFINVRLNWIMPKKDFFLYMLLLCLFIFFQIFTLKYFKKRFDQKRHIVKIVEFISYLILGILMFLFFLYLFPGAE